MIERLRHEHWRAMIKAAREQILANQSLLSQLDSAVGDGDHGAAMLRAWDKAVGALAESPGPDLKALFGKVAWAVMSCDGGSTGPLLGSFFMGMSEAAAGKTELGFADVVGLFEAGIAKMQKQSRARVGDKTMMDALLPALDALKAAPVSAGIAGALKQAAEAAAKGAEATKNMRAKFGRARHLGDRVLGHADPGATSVSLIFKGFGEAIASI